MASTVDSVLSDIKNNKFAPVYFLQGDEPFYIDEIAEAIEHSALPEKDRAFNQTILYGKDTNVGDIISQARSFSMFSDRKVIIVREAQEIKGFDKEDAVKLISNYLKNPQAGTILVFAYKHKELDKRKKIYKELEQLSVFVHSKKMYENQVPDWVEKYVKSQGFKIGVAARALMCENVGVEISKLANELKKIFINLKEGEEVTTDLIHKYVGISRDYNVFELQKTLVSKNFTKAIQIVQYFDHNEKANPLMMVLGNLNNFFIKILQTHASANKSEAHLASVLKVNPYFVKDYLAACKTFSMPKCLKIIHALRLADMQAKGFNGTMTSKDVLTDLMVKILN